MFTEIDHRGEIFNRKLKSIIQKERKIVHDLRENISKWEEETIAFSAASNLSIFTVREYLFSCGHRNKKKNDRPTNCPILVVIHRRVSKSSKSKEETAFLQLRNCRYLPFFEKRPFINEWLIWQACSIPSIFRRNRGFATSKLSNFYLREYFSQIFFFLFILDADSNFELDKRIIYHILV